MGMEAVTSGQWEEEQVGGKILGSVPGGGPGKRHLGSRNGYGPGSQQMFNKRTLTPTLLIASPPPPPVSQTHENLQGFTSRKKNLRSTVIWLKEYKRQKTKQAPILKLAIW